MYLVILPEGQAVRWLFVDEDPRPQGCPFAVEEGVRFDDGNEELSAFKKEKTHAEFGRSKSDPRHYRQFRSVEELQGAGFERLPGRPTTSPSWQSYTSLNTSIGARKGEGRTSHG
jgi:hypothetical protein